MTEIGIRRYQAVTPSTDLDDLALNRYGGDDRDAIIGVLERERTDESGDPDLALKVISGRAQEAGRRLVDLAAHGLTIPGSRKATVTTARAPSAVRDTRSPRR
jgi:hypothetical protein